MANYYEILLVPTDVDNERLQERYHQIEDSENRWPIDPYYPMSLDLFLLAYQTLFNPVKRAAYDQEDNIVPRNASFKTCFEWTWEQARETAGEGRASGPYFAHIGIANLLNGGQIDFINGYEFRRTLDKQLALITPDDDSEDMGPPYRISLPGCTAYIDEQQTLSVWQKNKKHKTPDWGYEWNAGTNEWFERPICPFGSDQAKARHGPIDPPDLPG